MYPAPREIRFCKLPYACGVCTNATCASAKNGTVWYRKSSAGTKSASRITKKSPEVTDRAWLMFPAFAPALSSRTTYSAPSRATNARTSSDFPSSSTYVVCAPCIATAAGTVRAIVSRSSP